MEYSIEPALDELPSGVVFYAAPANAAPSPSTSSPTRGVKASAPTPAPASISRLPAANLPSGTVDKRVARQKENAAPKSAIAATTGDLPFPTKTGGLARLAAPFPPTSLPSSTTSLRPSVAHVAPPDLHVAGSGAKAAAASKSATASSKASLASSSRKRAGSEDGGPDDAATASSRSLSVVSSGSLPSPNPNGSHGPIMYNYLILPGNNSRVILSTLRRRPWFGSAPKDAPMGSPSVNLVWEMWRSADRCNATPVNAYTAFNHVDGNKFITSKKGLWMNLARYFHEKGSPAAALNGIVPPTFLLKHGALPSDSELSRFSSYVNKSPRSTAVNVFGIEMPTDHGSTFLGDPEDFLNDKDGSGEVEGSQNDGAGDDGCADEAAAATAASPSPSVDDDGAGACDPGSVWIVKPAALTNRGCGIQVCKGYDEVIAAISKPSGSAHNDKLTKRHGFVVQKYIERPLLVYGRKFDLRVYVLLTVSKKSKKAYMYSEPYVRTSSVPYSLSKKSICDKTVHLTNDAVQNKVEGLYGKFEEGNKLSFKDFDEYLQASNGTSPTFVQDVLLTQLQELCKTSIAATHKVMNTKFRKFGFEMMGYDFMLDADLKPWLIEVNTNPCLEFACPLLHRLIEEVIESTFQIAVDPHFAAPTQRTKKCEQACKDIEEWGKKNQFKLVFDAEDPKMM